ncbi:hypothetical protein ALC53_07516 [Atta colombica]|uniref:Protein takeout n=1 Tax=Atta colombica TaxID=520822 RepID=A0A151I367_9HYME|nr:hypothetical protein ALC53_07516 [Atta colombica]
MIVNLVEDQSLFDDCRRCRLIMIKDVIAAARRFHQLTWLTVLLHSTVKKIRRQRIRGIIRRRSESNAREVCRIIGVNSTSRFYCKLNNLMFVLSSYYVILNTFIKLKLFVASYIHVCGRNNPNYNQCIVNNTNNIKSKICMGIPELNVAPIEPMNIDEIVIYNIDNLKLSVKKSKIRGFCDFIINSLQVSSDKLHFDLDLILKHLDMESVYDFDIRILVPLANKGLIHVSTVKTVLNIKMFKYKFDDSEKDLVQLHEALTNIINENEKDIFIKVKPALEEAVSKLVITVINNVVRNRFEQLFPNEA